MFIFLMSSESHKHLKDPVLRDWVLLCFRIGALAFGGSGRAMLYRDALVIQKKWLTADEFQEIYTITSVLPGSNLINLAAYIGYKLFGNMAALLGVIALGAPGALLALVVLWFVPIQQPDVARIFQGFSIGSIALFAIFIAQIFTGLRGHHIQGPLPRAKYLLRLVIVFALVVASLCGISFLVTLVGGLVFCLLIEFLA